MKIHILGIAGTMTAPLALALKTAGHSITGSDQIHIYPPFSRQLARAGIPINPDIRTLSPDLVIVGSAFNKFNNTQAEFEFIKNQKMPYISATQYLATRLIKPQSILVAGSFGKTTITALISWILTKSKLNPAYFFGGQSQNRFPSLKFSSSDWSVIEADESQNGLDIQAKFLYYPVKYLVLTSALWEHRESYPTAADNTAAFIKLIQKLPKDGLLIYNRLEPSAAQLIKFAACPCLPYDTAPATNYLFGAGNQNNLAAAMTLCRQFGLTTTQINRGISSFRGIKRRLELVSQVKNTYFYDDFAQSPQRIQESLLALRARHPGQKILVFFEAHASFLQYKSAIAGIDRAFAPADKVFLSKLAFKSHLSKSARTTSFDYKQALSAKLVYLPIYSELQHSILSSLGPGNILVHFSSGGLSGLQTFKRIINLYQTRFP